MEIRLAYRVMGNLVRSRDVIPVESQPAGNLPQDLLLGKDGAEMLPACIPGVPRTGEDSSSLTQRSVLSSFLWHLGFFLWFRSSREKWGDSSLDEKSLEKGSPVPECS